MTIHRTRELRYARVHIRPLHAGEEQVLQTVFRGLSAQSRYRRYFTVNPELPASTARQLAAIDGTSHLAMAAFDGRRPIGIARLVAVRDQDALPGRRAELGIEVIDAWHGRGIGTRLLRAIAAEGSHAGYTTVIANVRADNAAVCALLRSVFASVDHDGPDEDGQVTFTALLADAALTRAA